MHLLLWNPNWNCVNGGILLQRHLTPIRIRDKEEIQKVLKTYLEKHFSIEDDKQVWFDKMKDLAEKMGYAREVKAYKQEPEKYKGHVGDISTVIRVALTGRSNTPDLYEIMQVLGEESIKQRINKITK